MRTNKDITIKRGVYSFDKTEIFIPKGTKVDNTNGEYFVCPSFFPHNSIDRHDATYYGFRIKKEDVEI